MSEHSKWCLLPQVSHSTHACGSLSSHSYLQSRHSQVFKLFLIFSLAFFGSPFSCCWLFTMYFFLINVLGITILIHYCILVTGRTRNRLCIFFVFLVLQRCNGLPRCALGVYLLNDSLYATHSKGSSNFFSLAQKLISPMVGTGAWNDETNVSF